MWHGGLDNLRMLKKAVQRPQRAKRRGVPLEYVEPFREARTPLEDFFSILLSDFVSQQPLSNDE
jgi:hypothetical protein